MPTYQIKLKATGETVTVTRAPGEAVIQLPRTNGKIAIRDIVIEWSESGALTDGQTFGSFRAASVALSVAASRRKPYAGGYYKTSVILTWADGRTYQARIDLTHEDHGHLANVVGAHVRAFCEFSSGRKCPPHMTAERYTAYLRAMDRESPREGFAEILDGYALDDGMATIDGKPAERPAPVAPPVPPPFVPDAVACAALRFLWNGIKGANGVLQPAGFRFHPDFAGYTAPNGNTIQPPRPAHFGVDHRDHCGHFAADVHAAFNVRNNTDSQSDYFDHDRFDVEQDHPLFAAVATACMARLEHDAKQADKRATKHREPRYNGDAQRKEIEQIRALLAVRGA